MKSLVYTKSKQKKPRQLKPAVTNRDPFFYAKTLISTQYNNLSGLSALEYINNVSNIKTEFLKYFEQINKNNSDLLIFYDINIRHIGINIYEPKNIYFSDQNMNIFQFDPNSFNRNLQQLIPQNTLEQINRIEMPEFIMNYDYNVGSLNNDFIKINEEKNIFIRSEFEININNVPNKLNNILDAVEIQTDLNFDDNYSQYAIQDKFTENINMNINTCNILNLLKNINNDSENNIYFKDDKYIFPLEEHVNTDILTMPDENNKNYNRKDIFIELKKININSELINYTEDKDEEQLDYEYFNFNLDKKYILDNKLLDVVNISNDVNIKNVIEMPSLKINNNSQMIFEYSDIEIEDKKNNNRIFINNYKNIFSFDNANGIINENYVGLESEINLVIPKQLIKMPLINEEQIKLKIDEIDSNKINIFDINLNKNISISNFIPSEDIENINKSLDEKHDITFNINSDVNVNVLNFINSDGNNDEDINKNKINEEEIKNILFYIKEKIYCITNVYQLIYNNGLKATGLGDFIRGSYFLMEFCKKYGMRYSIDISNHPIKYFLKSFNNINLSENIKNKYGKINKFQHDNFSPLIRNNIINNSIDKNIYYDFMYYLKDEIKSLSNSDNKIILPIYAITFPVLCHDTTFKKYMRNLLEPTNKMLYLLNSKMNALKIKCHEYGIIHIRCGDDSLSYENINENKYNFDVLINDLNLLNPNKKYILISDNNRIKYFIKEKYNFITSLFHPIVHTAEATIKNIENTLLDFYLISQSNNVMSYSIYKHGSGFSKWCAFTYEIPYVCKYIGRD